MPNDDIVLQLNEKVVKSEDDKNYDCRLCALESEISEPKSLLFDYKAKKRTQFKKERKPKAEGEIRTRVVASTGP